jgi:hypothetical protein
MRVIARERVGAKSDTTVLPYMFLFEQAISFGGFH